GQASRRRAVPRRRSGASLTAWPWPTGGGSPRATICPAFRPRWAPGWGAAPATTRCSRSPPRPPAGPRCAAPARRPRPAPTRVEAAALGNVLVQARALGAGPADLAGMRALLRETQPLRRFEPSGSAAAWDAAARRIHG